MKFYLLYDVEEGKYAGKPTFPRMYSTHGHASSARLGLVSLRRSWWSLPETEKENLLKKYEIHCYESDTYTVVS